jgi:Flp pilus assembly protein TadG
LNFEFNSFQLLVAGRFEGGLTLKMRKLLFKDKDGQSIIEFALVLPILLMVLFGITEFGRAIMVTNVLNTASREGARLGAVAGDTTSVVGRVNAVLSAANLKGATVDPPVYDPTQKTVTVTVRYNFKVLSGGILNPFMGIIPLKGTTVMRYEG